MLASQMRMVIVPTALIDMEVVKQVFECEVFLLPVHSQEMSRFNQDSHFSRDKSQEKQEVSCETVVTYF